jgi:hypothetical protein
VHYSVDLVWASRVGTAPGLTWTHPPEVLALFDNNPSTDFDAVGHELYHQISRGIVRIPGITPHQRRAIVCAAKVTVALDQHLRDPNTALGWGTIVQGRNSVQHGLLSLSPAIQDGQGNRLHRLELLNYEICRLACLIYSNMVLFPMPPPTAIKLLLSDQLLMQLLLLDPFDPLLTDTERAFFAWAATLGGIAAFSTLHRKAYARLIYVQFIMGSNSNSHDGNNIPLATDINYPWQHVWGAQCRQFLWWDHLLSGAGERLWREGAVYAEEYFSEQLGRSANAATYFEE